MTLNFDVWSWPTTWPSYRVKVNHLAKYLRQASFCESYRWFIFTEMKTTASKEKRMTKVVLFWSGYDNGAPLQRVLNTRQQESYLICDRVRVWVILAVSHCQDQVQTLPIGSQSDGRSSAEVHCRPPDTGRRNLFPIFTLRVNSRRFRRWEADSENRRTCGIACLESATDRGKIVPVYSTVQSQRGDWKYMTWKWRTIQITGNENAGPGNDGPNCRIFCVHCHL